MGILRFLLALSVVLTHLNTNLLVGGQIAVQTFFIISGFLICHVLLSNPKYRNVSLFYKSRFFRIYPLYLAVLLLALLLQIAVQVVHNDSRIIEFYAENGLIPALLLIASNIIIFGQDLVMFGAAKDGSVYFTSNFRAVETPLYHGLLIPQAWSLAIEITFYLIAPLLIRRTKYLIIVLCLSVFTRSVIIYLGIGFSDPWSYRFLPNEIFFFILGSLARIYLLDQTAKFNVPKYSVIVLQSAITLLFPVIPIPNQLKSILYLLVTVINLSELFLSRASGSRFQKFDRMCGELSFPIYICHLTVIELFYNLFKLPENNTSMMIILLSTIFLSLILYKLLVQPIERMRKSLK